MSDARSIQDLPDGVPADVHAEDLARPRLGLRGRLGELDAARLPATAGQHLRLDDDRAAELLGRCARVGRARHDASLRDGDPVAPEELFPLELVQVQSAGESTAGARPGAGDPYASMVR